jgi:hypothetical protein
MLCRVWSIVAQPSEHLVICFYTAKRVFSGKTGWLQVFLEAAKIVGSTSVMRALLRDLACQRHDESKTVLQVLRFRSSEERF